MIQQLARYVSVVRAPHSPARLSQCFSIELGFGYIQKLVKKITRKLRVSLYGQNPVCMAHQVIRTKLTAAQKLKTFSWHNDLIAMHCVESNRP